MVDHKALSTKLAELYKCQDYLHYNGHDYFYITQDDATMFRMAIDNDVIVSQDEFTAEATYWTIKNGEWDSITTFEPYSLYIDKYEANRVAIAKTLIEKVSA